MSLCGSSGEKCQRLRSESIIPYYLIAPWAPKSNLLPKHIFYMSRPWKRCAFEWGFGSVVVWHSQEVMGGVGGREPGELGRGNFAKLSPRAPSSAPTHGRPIRAPLLLPDLYLCLEAQNHIYIYIFFFFFLGRVCWFLRACSPTPKVKNRLWNTFFYLLKL